MQFGGKDQTFGQITKTSTPWHSALHAEKPLINFDILKLSGHLVLLISSYSPNQTEV